MSTLPPEYTAHPGAGPHDNGPAFHAWLEELDAMDEDPASPQERACAAAWHAELDRERMDEEYREPQAVESPAERRHMEALFLPKPKPRTLHHVTIRVPIMATSPEHAAAQAVHMARDGFGSRTLFELLKVESPDGR